MKDLLWPSLLDKTVRATEATHRGPSKAIYGKIIIGIVLNLDSSRIKDQDIVLVLEFHLKILFQAWIEEA